MARDYFPGVGEAVADRTINRKGEGWGDVAKRVALGNNLLTGASDPLEQAIADGRILLSGRHLQHGDADQPNRPMEVFTNCSTASQRAILFYLLLNGSGVGTSYDDDMCVVNWNLMPTVIPVLSRDHADYTGAFPFEAEGQHYFKVPDSREGWAEAVQFVEDLTFMGDHRYERVVLDFSDVRPKGSPIGGMQDRPSSGPVPLMEAFIRMNEIKEQRLPLWRQAMEIDHILAEIVLVGGARRAARIAIKWWEDFDTLEFINCKREGGLWTANNSIGVDKDFWDMVTWSHINGFSANSRMDRAYEIFKACVEAQYRHGTGEPGFLNMDMLSEGEVAPSVETSLALNGRFNLSETALQHREELSILAQMKKYPVIVNPCGEIRLALNGAYCVIGDVAAAFCETQDQLEEACALVARALVRTNTMPAFYQGEVRRTNRIGVALTGLHEYAWSRFGLTFHELVEPGVGYMLDANGNEMLQPSEKSKPFWHSLFKAAMHVEATLAEYCQELGVAYPTTNRTIKPAGTTSKLFGLTEGAHLPAMREYLRWVQFRSDSPLIDDYEKAGYPVRRDLTTYKGTTIVGFPTRLLITELMGPNVVTATEATPDQQIRWIRLLETYWLTEAHGNQISYTLKYDPKDVSFEEYTDFILDSVPLVRAVSIMPQIDETAYEYQPEEPITSDQYDQMMKVIHNIKEDIGLEHVGCSTGACPIDFK